MSRCRPVLQALWYSCNASPSSFLRPLHAVPAPTRLHIQTPSSPSTFSLLHHTISSVSPKQRKQASWQMTKTLIPRGDGKKTRIVLCAIRCVRVVLVFSVHFTHQKLWFFKSMVNSTVFPRNFSTIKTCLQTKRTTTSTPMCTEDQNYSLLYLVCARLPVLLSQFQLSKFTHNDRMFETTAFPKRFVERAQVREGEILRGHMCGAPRLPETALLLSVRVVFPNINYQDLTGFG